MLDICGSETTNNITICVAKFRYIMVKNKCFQTKIFEIVCIAIIYIYILECRVVCCKYIVLQLETTKGQEIRTFGNHYIYQKEPLIWFKCVQYDQVHFIALLLKMSTIFNHLNWTNIHFLIVIFMQVDERVSMCDLNYPAQFS